MIPVCRVGDTGMGQCPLHLPLPPIPYNTVIMSGSPVALTQTLPIATIGSPGISTCGHPTVSMMGSTISTSTALGLHRLGDTGLGGGPYVMTIGSTVLFSN